MMSRHSFAQTAHSSSVSSSFAADSSMAISLNSSESKTSPHSRHSTYSVSSWRETIRTLGCLQAVTIVLEIGSDLEVLAADCSYLLHIFKRQFGESFSQVLTQDQRKRFPGSEQLKSRHYWSYTKYGPKKSDIPCSSSPKRPTTD